jgi:lipopolysaccharide transport system ATP-binding protein
MDVISVEEVYKQYRLGQISTGTIAHDLNRWWHRVRGKEDPYQKITGVNNREESAISEYVWALQDINFSVKQGEVLGLIGRNGAGKSTLLKILSKVTSPTKGNIKVRGRVASLLEVGTGFHPELTGRENIFLNGAILGMTKKEIRAKFDEIVAFSGVEKYVDTPVKRYSSGMYVRLAFAVAAHLEPEILIVDEVLAVGDADFQAKCLRKMKDVSSEGRTVLFVSHNMQAIQKLCTSAILLNKGGIQANGDVQQIIDLYFKKESNSSLAREIEMSNLTETNLSTGYPLHLKFEDLAGVPLDVLPVGKYWQLRIRFKLEKPLEHFIISIGISTSNDVAVYTAWSEPESISPGIYEAVFANNQLLFATGHYRLAVGLSNHERAIFYSDDIINFEILDIKEVNIIDDTRILRTAGCGVVINPIKVDIIMKNEF